MGKRRRWGTARAGFSLVELAVALAIIGVLAALAAPAFDTFLARQRTRGALDRFSADLYYARMLAVRNGWRVTVRLDPSLHCTGSNSGQRWRIVVLEPTPRLVRVHSLKGDLGGPCLGMNGSSDTLTFNSRGMLVPFGNRTVRARQGAVADSLSISVLGRAYRRY